MVITGGADGIMRAGQEGADVAGEEPQMALKTVAPPTVAIASPVAGKNWSV